VIEFTLAAKDFKKAVNLILVGRAAHIDSDLAHFGATADRLELSSCSRATPQH
jgi:hypothetical protein